MALALALAGAAMGAYGQNPPRGQQEATDDSLAHELGSVVILPASAEELKREHKPLASLDRYLEGTPGVNMVRRGAFAWEPLLNGMAMTLLAVYRPHWVNTFFDREYLGR